MPMNVLSPGEADALSIIVDVLRQVADNGGVKKAIAALETTKQVVADMVEKGSVLDAREAALAAREADVLALQVVLDKRKDTLAADEADLADRKARLKAAIAG